MRGRRSERRGVGQRVRSSARALRFEALEHRELLATFTVTNTGDLILGVPVVGGLRYCILQANANPGLDTINFNIGGGGGGIQTINLQAALPTITDPVTISGLTQGGAGYSSTPLIEINGTGIGSSGLVLAAPSTVSGLTINRFGGNGIDIRSSGCTVQHCYIGTNNAGNAASPNGGAGVLIESTANNHIGGSRTATTGNQGNVISGNKGYGIEIDGFGASGNNAIQGNLIGVNITGSNAVPNGQLDPLTGQPLPGGGGILLSSANQNQIGGLTPDLVNVISGNNGPGIDIRSSLSNTINGNQIGTDSVGTTPVPNLGDGISLLGSSLNKIGGTSAGAGNLISGNQGNGIAIQGGQFNYIQGNQIGTDVTGLVALGSTTASDGITPLLIGNLKAGVSLTNSSNNQIGGTTTGAPNIIAFNGTSANQGGVHLSGGTGNQILSNSIFANDGDPTLNPANFPTGLGIMFDPSFGANNQQPAPVLTSAITGAGRTVVKGTLTVPGITKPTQFTIQFFSNPLALASNTTAPPAGNSGFWEGKVLIAQLVVTTDQFGTAAFNYTLPNPVAIGDFITATATKTDPSTRSVDTSQFSDAQQVITGAVADLGVSIRSTPTVASTGSDLQYDVTIINNGPDPVNNVILTDTLDPALISAANPPTLSFSQTLPIPPQLNGNIVTVTVPQLAAGATATLTIHVTPTVSGQVVNTASVTGQSIDVNQSNNTARLKTTVNVPADLEITVARDDTTPAAAGAETAYFITIQNKGPGTATGIVLNASLPIEAPIDSSLSSASQGAINVGAGNSIQVAIGTLPQYYPARVRVVALPTVAGDTITLNASVTANEHDPDLSNNAATLDTTIQGSADLAVVSMIASPEPATDHLDYTVTITNNGLDDAGPFYITDPLPAELIPVNVDTGSLPADTIVSLVPGNLLRISVPGLAVGATSTFTINTLPSGSGSITNTVTINDPLNVPSGFTPSQFDPDLANNSASAISTINPAHLVMALTASPKSGDLPTPPPTRP